jgi:hypothetical protein
MSVNDDGRQHHSARQGRRQPTEQQNSRAARLAAAATVFVLGIGTAAGLVTALTVLPHPFEINYGEGIVLGVAARFARGEPLYQPVAGYPYLVAAYTPLFYVLLAGLIDLFGPVLWPARALGLGGASLAAVCLYGTVCRERGARPALPGVLVLAATPWVAQWAAYGRVDMPALGLTAAGVWLAWRSSPGRWRLLLSLFCFLAAFLTKQTYLAAPVATALALALHRPRLGIAYLLGFAALVTGGTLALDRWSQGMFIQSAVVANANPPDMLWGLRIPVLWLALTLGLHAAVVVCLLRRLARQHRSDEPAGRTWRVYATGQSALMGSRTGGLEMCRLRDQAEALLQTGRALPVPLTAATLYLAITLCQMPAVLKAGSDVNYLLENALAVGLLAGLALPQFPFKPDSNGLPSWLVPQLWLLVAASAAGMAVVDVARAASVLPWAVDRAAWQRHALLVERIRRVPGDVLSEDLSLPVAAGKPAVFEPVLYDIFYTTGVVSPVEMTERLTDGRFGLLLLSAPMDRPGWEADPQVMWPRAIRAAMRQYYCLEGRTGRFYLYVPARDCARSTPGAVLTRHVGPIARAVPA